jgi:hydroxyacyl-ACP dehydratase HTD2-like protein with hotdog domain
LASYQVSDYIAKGSDVVDVKRRVGSGHGMFRRTSSHLLKRCTRSVYTLSPTESSSTADWINRSKLGLLVNKRAIPVEGLRWIESALPTTKSAPLEQRLSSGYLPDGYHFALPQQIRIDPPALDELGPDGTFAGDYLNPPSPFSRRMWAGGEFHFHKDRRISLRDPLYVKIKVLKIELKGLSQSEPKVFLTRRFEWANDPQAKDIAITEDRTHVFLTPSHRKTIRRGDLYILHSSTLRSETSRTDEGDPTSDFALQYTPSTTLLFRFSAVTQNDHKIHYEDAYSRDVEGLPGTLRNSFAILPRSKDHNQVLLFTDP